MSASANIKAFLQSPKAAGLKIRLLKSGEMSLCLVTVQKKKKEIDILECRKLKSIEELAEHVHSSMPLLVAVDGRGILHKRIENVPDEAAASLIGRILPNAQPKDFYLQKRQMEADSWLSIARKEPIDAILNQLTAAGCYVNDLILGPFSLPTILPAIEGPEKPTEFTDEEIVISMLKGEISSITEKKEAAADKTYPVAEKKLETQELIALGSAFQFYFKDPAIDRIDAPFIQEQISDFFHKRLFKQLGKGVLGLFMLILLINFLLFDHYNQKYDEVAASVRENESLLAELESIQNNLELKKEFMAKSGFTNASKISFFADELAKTVPASIKLQKMSINPILKRRKEGEKITFQFNEIQLRGVATESIELNEWIKKIKSGSWASEVNIIDFNQEKKRSGALFQLQIKIKKDKHV